MASVRVTKPSDCGLLVNAEDGYVLVKHKKQKKNSQEGACRIAVRGTINLKKNLE